MLLLREITAHDLLPSYALARQFSLYNFPLNARIIKEKINTSQKSFRGTQSKINSVYLFALEKWPSGQLLGVSQIKAMSGTLEVPDYYFAVDTLNLQGHPFTSLTLKSRHFGPTELGGLLLDKNFRGQGAGRFLSLGRVLFMGLKPKKFQDTVYAQLAPVTSPAGDSIFWEVLGKNFTGLSFEKANKYSRLDQKFVPQFYPSQRIYIYEDAQFFTQHPYLNNTPHLDIASQIFEAEELPAMCEGLHLSPGTLPPQACLLVVSSIEQLYLGSVGQETKAARYILEKQGLKYKNVVHHFDGGPNVGAEVQELEIIRHSKWHKLSSRKLPHHSTSNYMWLAYDGPQGFRAMPTHYKFEGGELVLPQATHQALHLQPGAMVYGYEHHHKVST